MPGVARDEALLEIDGVLEQPLDDEEEPLDGAAVSYTHLTLPTSAIV